MTLVNLTPQRYINECCDGSETAGLTWTLHCNGGKHSWEHPQDTGPTFLKGHIRERISIHTSRWWASDLLSLSFCTADYQITIITRTHNLLVYRRKPKPQTHGFPQGCPRNSVEQHVRNGQGPPSQEMWHRKKQYLLHAVNTNQTRNQIPRRVSD